MLCYALWVHFVRNDDVGVGDGDGIREGLGIVDCFVMPFGYTAFAMTERGLSIRESDRDDVVGIGDGGAIG